METVIQYNTEGQDRDELAPYSSLKRQKTGNGAEQRPKKSKQIKWRGWSLGRKQSRGERQVECQFGRKTERIGESRDSRDADG